MNVTNAWQNMGERREKSEFCREKRDERKGKRGKRFPQKFTGVKCIKSRKYVIFL